MAENTSFRFFQVIDEFNKNSEEILATFYQPETSYSLYIGVTDRHFLNVNVLSFFLYLFFNTAMKYSILIHVQILFEYMHWFFYQIENG